MQGDDEMPCSMKLPNCNEFAMAFLVDIHALSCPFSLAVHRIHLGFGHYRQTQRSSHSRIRKRILSGILHETRHTIALVRNTKTWSAVFGSTFGDRLL